MASASSTLLAHRPLGEDVAARLGRGDRRCSADGGRGECAHHLDLVVAEKLLVVAVPAYGTLRRRLRQPALVQERLPLLGGACVDSKLPVAVRLGVVGVAEGPLYVLGEGRVKVGDGYDLGDVRHEGVYPRVQCAGDSPASNNSDSQSIISH